jgi:hypothetical protein
MTIKQLFLLPSLIFLFGCFDNSDNQTISTNNTQSGLNIENGPRQGFQYIDSNHTEYNYRYYTMTITNDTTIPIKLSFGFTQLKMKLSDTSYSKIFLLPRHLTPKQQQFDTHGISKELKYFLDFDVNKPIQLDKIIKPTERCVLTFGVLTDIKFIDPTTPFGTKLLASSEKFKLKITDSLIIPCGQYSTLDK